MLEKEMDLFELKLRQFLQLLMKFNVVFITSGIKKIQFMNVNLVCDWEFRGALVSKTFLSVAFLISMTIYLMLLSQNLEANPGPGKLAVVTYNCNGLGNRSKLKRLLVKLIPMVNNGTIVFLQETHVINTEYLEVIWKNKYLSNCVSTKSAGVMILFGDKYKLEGSYQDNEGRHLMAAISDDESKYIISNSYLPNDHKESLVFVEKMYTKILEWQANNSEHLTICAGDWNCCLTKKDYLNRRSTQSEVLLAEAIVGNNRVAELSDAFRFVQPESGFTWKRGECYSRLDYVFVSNALTRKIKNVQTDWAFESSDHAAVKINFHFDNEPTKGPGSVKLNIKILDNPKVAKEVGDELVSMFGQAGDDWDPHAKLEYLKVVIRSVISSKVSEIRYNLKEEVKDNEVELNQIESLKINILHNQINNKADLNKRIESVDKASNSLKTKLAELRKRLDETMSFKSKAKWFEYGEKSNKYFLSLEKSKQSQKLIGRIRDENTEYVGQDQVAKGITEFYRKLYSKQDRILSVEDDGYYDECPKLSKEQSELMDKQLSLSELRAALATCKDSAPGPDGIPYSVYKKYWSLAGPIILNSWNHGLCTGIMTKSHLESTISLLPKEGKDVSDIRNWRPITLSNCDAKIITKALAQRTAKILHSIIAESQTAYVPGRSVADNLRSNFFFKRFCEKNRENAVMISLDAKKAFDSVDHLYIERTLKEYGFGQGFIKAFRVLYSGITARVMINGFPSEAIKIERGVKQGDALSCAIFIICIDPLIRNINKNKNIKEIKITSVNNIINNISFKAAAYADDVSIICGKDIKSIQLVFSEYERLTNRSGLELNADKTEILNLTGKDKYVASFWYDRKAYLVPTVQKMKICGLYFCNDHNEEYKLNVNDKIDKLKYKMKLWIRKFLTMEGKALIIKTFGISQIIYNMQSYGFKKSELVTIEREIFKFLWSTKNNESGIDRIKRSVMKNEFEEGGMKITDIESLNRSIKLRQFIRSYRSNHVIKYIQAWASCKSGDDINLYQEYQIQSENEEISQIAQETLNIIIDYNRKLYNQFPPERYEVDINLITEVASINLESYLVRKKELFLLCLIKPLTKIGVRTLGEMIQLYEYELDNKLCTVIKSILTAIPKSLVEIAKCYNNEYNSEDVKLKYIMISENVRMEVNMITVKEFQIILKKAMEKTDSTDFGSKLGIESYDRENITRFRSICKNPKLRNIYFRLIHNDFYTRVRMKKFNMTDSERCTRCENIENSKHLLWECFHVQNIWRLYNSMLTQINKEDETVRKYEDIFEVGRTKCLVIVKIKVIQALIQIERPKNWTLTNLKKIVKELIDIELYNAKISRKMDNFVAIWGKINESL
jgi:exonuclease III